MLTRPPVLASSASTSTLKPTPKLRPGVQRGGVDVDSLLSDAGTPSLPARKILAPLPSGQRPATALGLSSSSPLCDDGSALSDGRGGLLGASKALSSTTPLRNRAADDADVGDGQVRFGGGSHTALSIRVRFCGGGTRLVVS